jgi:hypothetical protein
MKEHFSSWVPKVIGMGAITLPPFGIFYRWSKDELKPPAAGFPYGYSFVRRHEAQHVRQWLDMGGGLWGALKFYCKYLWQAVTHGFSHDKIPMEQDAIAHELFTDWPVPESVLPRSI